MLVRLHVGITVWPARSDFFFSLRRWVAAHPQHEGYLQLSLPAEMLNLVARIEYSPFWIFRAFIYRRVNRFLERQVADIMSRVGKNYSEVVFYTPDDGYWAELLNTIRHRVGGPMRIFNIQHGHAALIKRPQKLRRFFNLISESLSGYPNFGYGFGAGTLDGYIVMSDLEKNFIDENFKTPSYIAPEFIRGDFFDRVLQSARTGEERTWHILFAMVPTGGKKSNIFGARDWLEAQFFQDVADCLRAISDAVPCEIRLRFHPGQDRVAAEAAWRRSKMDMVCEIDESTNIVDSLAWCDFVLAYCSTVLLEAPMLSKVPVNFEPAAYPPPYPLGIASETIILERSGGNPTLQTSRGSLENLFSAATLSDYVRPAPHLDIEAPLPWL